MKTRSVAGKSVAVCNRLNYHYHYASVACTPLTTDGGSVSHQLLLREQPTASQGMPAMHLRRAPPCRPGAVLVDRWGGQGRAKRAGSSSAIAISSTYSHHSSSSSDNSEPVPENSATHMLPTTRAAPSAAPPALDAAPPPLPADLAQMFDEPFGLGAQLAAPLATSAAPTVSRSSSWLELQQLAEMLEVQLTGVEAIEVSETIHS